MLLGRKLAVGVAEKIEIGDEERSPEYVTPISGTHSEASIFEGETSTTVADGEVCRMSPVDLSC